MVNRTRVEGGGYSKHDIITSVEVLEVSKICGPIHAGSMVETTRIVVDALVTLPFFFKHLV